MLISRHRLQWPLTALWLLSSMAGLDVQAHEFWIEPAKFELAPGDLLEAHVRVGQDMKGDSLRYIPQLVEAFRLTTGGATRDVKSRIGDDPALSERVPDSGLHLLSYVSTDSQLTYSDPEKFRRFVETEGIQWVSAAHERRGLPVQGFSEDYQRFAKSLVKVGDGKGQDRPLGLEFELVLETNPYTDPDAVIVAQLQWLGKPLADAQISVFRRHRGEVSRTNFRTDVGGRISLPRRDAPGVYLLNAVHMIELPPNAEGAVWKSLWASTTFEVVE